MARRARVISIDLQAGTASFFRDLDQASGKLKQFGRGTVSDMQASSAAIREAMGGNNLRAVERFVGTVLGLGPALAAAFPVVGAVAFGGIIVDLGEKANKFFKELKEAPEQARQAFHGLSAEGALTNAELQQSIDGLNKEIDKLEGTHHNALKDLIDEARLSAEKLDIALDQAFGKLTKQLDENAVGKPWGLLTAQKSNYDAREMSRAMQAKLDEATEQANAKLRGLAANPNATLEDLNAARKEKAIALQKALNEVLADTNRLLQEDANIQRGLQSSGDKYPGILSGGSHVDVTKDVNALNLLKREIENKQGEIRLSFEEGSAKQKVAILNALKDNAVAERPYTNKINELKAQLAGLNAEIGAVGKSEGEQILAKAAAEADKAIATIRDEVKKRTPGATPDTKKEDEIREDFKANAAAEAELEWKRKIVSTTDSLRGQRQEQELLTAAIGKGYEAARTANIEAEVMRGIGAKNYFTPGFLSQHSGQVSGIRSEAGAAQDQKHIEQTAQATQKLKESIELEDALAATYRDGAEAVRQATIAVEAHRMALAGATAQQIAAYIAESDAKVHGEMSKRITDVDLETEARKRLNAAILRGAEAQRQAALENKVAEIQRGPGTQADRDTLIQKVRAQAQVDEQTRVDNIAAASRKVAVIDEQINDLYKALAVAGAGQAQINADILAKERERLSVMREQALAANTITSGLRAAMLEFQIQAKTTSQIVADLTHQAIEGAENLTAKNLSDLMTGQHKKGEFGKDLQQYGGSLIQSSLKAGMDKILGLGKADGSSEAQALWVKMAGTGVGIPGVPSGGGGGSSSSGDIFSGGLGAIMHMFGFGLGAGHAGGGGVSPGTIYPVGEQGPEYFAPDQPGTIIPNGKLGGGGNVTIHNHIDARGSDLGAYNRIARGLEMTHDQAVAHAQQAAHEHAKRTPGK